MKISFDCASTLTLAAWCFRGCCAKRPDLRACKRRTVKIYINTALTTRIEDGNLLLLSHDATRHSMVSPY